MITDGFSGRDNFRVARRRYTKQVFAENVISHDFPRSALGKTWVVVDSSEEDAMDINHHDNDPLVITIQPDNWDIRHVMINPGSSADVLFLYVFQKLQLNMDGI